MSEDLIYTIEHTTREAALQSMQRSCPSVVYKFRSWSEEHHPDSLLLPTIYFTHPKYLNDPHDIHIPIEFNVSEIDDPRFFEKVKQVVAKEFPRLIPGTVPFMSKCVDLMERIRKDPQAYFQQNYADLLNSDTYDCYGVFSTTKNGLSENVWAYYGKDHTGFAVGYSPIEIMNLVVCSMGTASYRDKPVKHSFLKETDAADMINDFVKGRRWEHEEEYRFVTLMIQNDQQRAVRIPRSFIREVSVGYKISSDDLESIKKALTIFYGKQVPLYQVRADAQGFGLLRDRIDY